MTQHQPRTTAANDHDASAGPDGAARRSSAVEPRHATGRAKAPSERYHHGRSPAAWTGSMVALAGFVLAAVGFFLNINWVVVGVGLGIVAVGALTGAQMARAGRGQVWE